MSIPSSVQFIGRQAFADNRLDTVEFGSGVGIVEEWSFKGNPVSRMVFMGAPPEKFPSAADAEFDTSDLAVKYRAEYDESEYDGGFTEPTWRGYDTKQVGDTGHSSLFVWSLVGGGILLVVLAAAGFIVVLRRRQAAAGGEW